MNKEYAALYVTADDEVAAAKRLYDIVRVLRQKCPWDKVQTHAPYVLGDTRATMAGTEGRQTVRWSKTPKPAPVRTAG